MKIYALLDVNSLMISSKKATNLQNCTNFAYKQSELGADALVICGKPLETLIELSELLRNDLDIPIFIFYDKITQEESAFVKNSLNNKYKKMTTITNFVKEKECRVLIFKNSDLIEFFKGTEDCVPEMVSSTVTFAYLKNVKIIICEEVESARESLKAIKKLM